MSHVRAYRDLPHLLGDPGKAIARLPVSRSPHQFSHLPFRFFGVIPKKSRDNVMGDLPDIDTQLNSLPSRARSTIRSSRARSQARVLSLCSCAMPSCAEPLTRKGSLSASKVADLRPARVPHVLRTGNCLRALSEKVRPYLSSSTSAPAVRLCWFVTISKARKRLRQVFAPRSNRVRCGATASFCRCKMTPI